MAAAVVRDDSNPVEAVEAAQACNSPAAVAGVAKDDNSLAAAVVDGRNPACHSSHSRRRHSGYRRSRMVPWRTALPALAWPPMSGLAAVLQRIVQPP